MASESRVDLLNWVNQTLNLNYTKIEQLGSGAAYCQLMDSIFLDVPMTRVKFDASKEYEYLGNFKILQATFLKHKITKTIPVERLIKCRFQDNLEFFQWIRKFWRENKDETDYDPDSRRKYAPPPPAAAAAGTGALSGSTVATSSRRASQTPATTSRRVVSGSSLAGGTRSRISSTSNSAAASRVPSGAVSNPVNKELEHELSQTKVLLHERDAELGEYKAAVDALETERNFYFNKLREIEILTETTTELLKTAPGEDQDVEVPTLKDILARIQQVLYSTEEGFQAPEDSGGDVDFNTNGVINVQKINNDIDMEEETF